MSTNSGGIALRSPRAWRRIRASDERVVGRVDDLAERAAAPDLGDPVPAIAREQRHRVDHDEPLDQLRRAAGRRSAPGRPSRGRPACAADPRARRGSARERPRARTSSSRSGSGRAVRASPARHVDRDRRAAAFQERQPVLAVGRDCRGSRRSASRRPAPAGRRPGPRRAPAPPLRSRSSSVGEN